MPITVSQLQEKSQSLSPEEQKELAQQLQESIQKMFSGFAQQLAGRLETVMPSLAQFLQRILNWTYTGNVWHRHTILGACLHSTIVLSSSEVTTSYIHVHCLSSSFKLYGALPNHLSQTVALTRLYHQNTYRLLNHPGFLARVVLFFCLFYKCVSSSLVSMKESKRW